MPVLPAALATRALGLLLVLAYLATAINSRAWWDLPAGDLLRYGAAYGPAIAGGERWRLATAIFLHGGVLHLTFNLVALYDFGGVLERRFGGWRVVLTFLATGIAGFLASALWHPEDVSLGASGGLFGLLGWWAIAAWKLGEFLPAAERRRRLITLVTIVGIALGFGFVLPGIDNAAHLGGLASGLLLGTLALARPHLLPLAASMLALLALAGTSLLPGELADRYRESRAFDERYTAFAQEDRAISQALLTLGEDSRRRRLSDAAALARLENELLPRLAAQLARLEAAHYTDPHLATENHRWMRYAKLRLEAVQAIRDAVTGRDPDGLRRFEQKMGEAAGLARRSLDVQAVDPRSETPPPQSP